MSLQRCKQRKGGLPWGGNIVSTNSSGACPCCDSPHPCHNPHHQPGPTSGAFVNGEGAATNALPCNREAQPSAQCAHADAHTCSCCCENMSVMRVLSTRSNVTVVRESKRPDWKWGTTLQGQGPNGKWGDAGVSTMQACAVVCGLGQSAEQWLAHRTRHRRLHGAGLLRTHACMVRLHTRLHTRLYVVMCMTTDAHTFVHINVHMLPTHTCAQARTSAADCKPGWVAAQRQDLQQRGVRYKVEARELAALCF